MNEKKRMMIFVLIVGIFLGQSLSMIGGSFVASIEPAKKTEVYENNGTPSITIVSFAEDEILTKSVNDLRIKLDPFIDVTTETVVSLDHLDFYLDQNSEDYFVLFGHSNEAGINIAGQEVAWLDLSNVVTQNSEQVVIIPTCYSFNLYDNNEEALVNVLSPFEAVVDYRISVDFSALALGAFLEEEELVTDSISSISNDFEYMLFPEETLWTRITGTYTARGKGKISIYDVFAEFLNRNSFIIGSSFTTAITYGIFKLFGRSITPITFIIQLLSVYSNFQSFSNFFMFKLNLLFAEYVVDSRTVISYDCTYEEFGWGRFIFLGLTHSTTYYTFWGQKYVQNGVTKQKYYNVRMICNLYILDQLVLYDSGLSLGIFSTQLVSWKLSSSGTKIIGGGGGGGGKDIPL